MKHRDFIVEGIDKVNPIPGIHGPLVVLRLMIEADSVDGFPTINKMVRVSWHGQTK